MNRKRFQEKYQNGIKMIKDERERLMENKLRYIDV